MCHTSAWFGIPRLWRGWWCSVHSGRSSNVKQYPSLYWNFSCCRRCSWRGRWLQLSSNNYQIEAEETRGNAAMHCRLYFWQLIDWLTECFITMIITSETQKHNTVVSAVKLLKKMPDPKQTTGFQCSCSNKRWLSIKRRVSNKRRGLQFSSNTEQIYQIYQMPPRQFPTVARQGLKFLVKKTYWSPQFTRKWRSSLFLKC